MPKDAPVDVGAPPEPIVGPYRRVSEMQAKLHCWAAADPGRRFDDLFNFVCDPATLLVAFERVAGNQGANTPGVDGLTAAQVEEVVGLSGFLDDLRTCLKDGSFRPLPVRERKIPKPGGSGKLRKLGIPTIADRVVQAALKLVLEPIFETDFEPVSYGSVPSGGLRTRSPRFTSTAPKVIGGCWMRISRRVSTPSHTPLFWIGCGCGSRTNGSWVW
jgi:RNA-directed DNA polymerase